MLRNAFELEHNGEISKLVSISTQVVAGVNYKIVFESDETTYEAVVYSQPWTQTVEVLYIKEAIKQNWFRPLILQ